ncbi:Sensor protein ZraS [Pseudodesulfovibrio hydrargyri]|uniref:histidine kinase n=1 Tax=Pseudodesulfovibrio hydrargyri TaxID=2125990 RepID=A0A1J5N6Y4_9BACT|nr:ATP-binding protein [Pseudodesulfovibrio hydrargyri]OIQ51395.1 Sensor protein ZraS [Pseudodesulfovibrio hydrargyri]
MQLKAKILGSPASVWMILGMATIMTLVVVTLAVFNYNREVRYMEKVLGEKGGALIRSFETGARVGMMGDYGAEGRLQALIDATAKLPDILYIVLTDRDGRIIAHSDSQKIGSVFLDAAQIESLHPDRKAQSVVLRDGAGAGSFVVYKEFVPLKSGGFRMMRDMMNHHMSWSGNGRGNGSGNGRRGMMMRRQAEDASGESVEKPLIFIGLDIAPFVEARRTDVRVMMTTSAVLLLVGLGCMVSLFWVQAYRRSREQLRDTQALAAEIVANLPIGMIVTGPDGCVTRINRDAAALLNVAPDDALGAAARDVLPAEVTDLAAESAETGAPVTRELSIRTRDTESPVNVGVAPVTSDGAAHLGTIYILSDLTEIHRLQADVKQREKMAAIGNLAAGIAHEVRNPLSSIKGYATYFAGLFDEGSDNRKAATVMIAETERLNRVISELLDFSRPSDFKFRKADPAMVLDTVSRLLQQDASDQGVELSMEVTPDLPEAEMDPDRMVQAVLNIGINGIQAMEPGGRLSLRARSFEGALVIEVEDTGRGIPEADLATIFDPYFTTKSQGTGLGLAVVRKIVEGHGGGVHVASNPGKGTTFAITLPQAH